MALINYGSDPNGLICGFLFAPGAPGRPMSLDEARAWVTGAPEGAPDVPGSFVWLHFNLSDASAEAWMREPSPWPPSFSRR